MSFAVPEKITIDREQQIIDLFSICILSFADKTRKDTTYISHGYHAILQNLSLIVSRLVEKYRKKETWF